MDMGLIMVVAVVALLIGILIGFLVSKAAAGNDRSGNMKNQMTSLESRFKEYQAEVANHFDKTANLSQKLAQDYQEMQLHLAHSVESLVSDSDLRTKLLAEIQDKEAKKIELKDQDTVLALDKQELQVSKQAQGHVESMPKDYAPKSPGDIGTLAEDFGIKRK